MPEFNVVIAGGGPSGLQFARELGGRTDYSVVVLEQNEALADNDKSTGGTFHQVIEGFDIPDRVIMDSSPDVIFEGPEAQSRLGIPNYVLDFPAFVEYLGKDAEEEGNVEIITGAQVLEPITTDGSVEAVRAKVDGKSQDYYGDVVVDATGPAGVLTSELEMWNPDAAQRGIGKEFQVKGTFENNSMLFRFDHEYAPGGYAWVFPGGDGVFKIGVCWVNDFYQRHKPLEDGEIDEYVRQWIESDDRWTVDEIEAVHAGQAVSDNSINQRAGQGIVAVGDAVSSINPLFGEGIRPGMESARMAADTVIEALETKNTSRSKLKEYEQRWNTEKGSKWKTQRMVGELLYDFDAEQQNQFVRKAGSLSAEQAERLQRYELTLPDLLSLYPFKLRDIPKAPTLLRHIW
jgi:digeranylgeranylglycerophospholipid reductase